MLSAMSETAPRADSPTVPPFPITIVLADGRQCLLRGATEEDAAELCEFLPKTHTESDFLNYLPGEFNKTVEEEKGVHPGAHE